MTANQILIVVIGLFLSVTGVIYLIHLKGSKESSERDKIVSLVLLIAGVLIAISPVLMDLFYESSSDAIKSKSSNLLGADFYQNPVVIEEKSYEEASELYEKAASKWNVEKSGYDSSEIVMQRLDRSIAKFETAHAYTARGQLKVQLSFFKSALKDYDKALELDPEFGNAYYNRATIHYLMGNNDLACADWKSANDLGVSNTEETLNMLCN